MMQSASRSGIRNWGSEHTRDGVFTFFAESALLRLSTCLCCCVGTDHVFVVADGASQEEPHFMYYVNDGVYGSSCDAPSATTNT